MSAGPIVSPLEAALQTGQALVEDLERQRMALIERDLDRVNELTHTLEGRFRRFALLLHTRAGLLTAEGTLTEGQAALLREVGHVEARVVGLARLNQELLADRLAGVSAMLGLLLPDSAAGAYAPAAPAGAHMAARRPPA
ncbi:MAG: hypothetical protein AB7Y46_17940 [Armatimonadota bacterium]